jgi:hypothetical protein
MDHPQLLKHANVLKITWEQQHATAVIIAMLKHLAVHQCRSAPTMMAHRRLPRHANVQKQHVLSMTDVTGVVMVSAHHFQSACKRIITSATLMEIACAAACLEDTWDHLVCLPCADEQITARIFIALRFNT